MNSKLYELAIKINGQLDESFAGALKKANAAFKNIKAQAIKSSESMSKMGKLEDKFTNLSRLQTAMQQYKKLSASVQNNSQALTQARNNHAQLSSAYKNEVKQLESMQTAYDRLKQVYRENKKNMSADMVAAMRQQIKDARKELSAQETKVHDTGRQYKSSDKGIGKLQSQLQNQHAQLAQLQSALNAGGISASNFASQESHLRAEIERTTAAIQRQAQIEHRQERFNQASANLSNAYNNFQGSIDSARTIMSPFERATKDAVDYEHQLTKLKALTQVRNIRQGNTELAAQEMAVMQAEIEKLGDTTEFTRLEVAGAAQKYAMSGYKPEQIKAILQPTIDVASATGTDVETVADHLSDQAQALGIKFGKTIEVAGKTYDYEGAVKHWGDVMSYATTQSNVDEKTFHEGIKYNAPVAAQAGLSMHEIAALNMTMANSAIKGSMAGTAVRSGILRLISPPKQAAKAMEEMGMSASDAQKAIAEAQEEMQNLGISAEDSVRTKIEKLHTALQGMSEQEAMGRMGKIFGTNGVSGWASVMANLNDMFKGYVNEMDSGAVEGWAADTANIMRQDTETQLKLFESAMAGLSTSVGNVFLPVINIATAGMTQLAAAMNSFAQENPAAVQWIGLLAAALSGLIVACAGANLAMAGFNFVMAGAGIIRARAMAIMELSVVQRMAAGASALFSAAQAGLNAVMMMNPVGLAVGAFLALGAAMLWVVSCCPGISEALSSAWNDPQGAVHGFTTLVKSLIDDAVNYVTARWNTLKQVISHPIDAVINFMDHGDVVGGNIKDGYSMINSMPTGSSGGGSFGESTVQAEVVQVQAAQVEQPQQDMTALNAVNETFNNIGMSAENFNQGLAQSAEIHAQNNSALEMNNTALQTTSAGLEAFNSALQSTNGGLTALSSSANSASSSLSGLGSAVQSAIAALQSAGSAAASAVSAAAANVGKPAQNYRGGIYDKGAFLTWFAEKSPEAAIPLDGSQRAISLWQMAGRELGMLPAGNNVVPSDKPKTTANNLTTLQRAQQNRVQQVMKYAESARQDKFKRLQEAEKYLPKQPERVTFPAQNKLDRLPANLPIERITFPRQNINQPSIFAQNPVGNIFDMLQNPIGSIFDMLQNPVGNIFDMLQSPGNIGSGIIGGLIDRVTGNKPAGNAANGFEIHFSVTISGNANAEEVQKGIEATYPMLEDFARNFDSYRHERQRVSFD